MKYVIMGTKGTGCNVEKLYNHNREIVKGRKMCRFFDELDEILGHNSAPAVVVDTGRE